MVSPSSGDDVVDHLVGDVLDLVGVDLLGEPLEDVLGHVKVICGIKDGLRSRLPEVSSLVRCDLVLVHFWFTFVRLINLITSLLLLLDF